MSKLNYAEKQKQVEIIMENNGYDKNTWQVFQKENSKIEIGSYSGIILEFLDVYQVLFNISDDEILSYFSKNAKSFIEIIMNCNFEAFKEYIEPYYDVEKIDNFYLRKIVQALALGYILKKIKSNELI